MPASGGRQSTRVTSTAWSATACGEEVDARRRPRGRSCARPEQREGAAGGAGVGQVDLGAGRDERRRPAGRAPAGRGRCRPRSTTTGAGRPLTAGASAAAGSSSAPWPSTTSSRITPVRSSAATRARCSRRRVGSIIGWARPAVYSSSPKSTSSASTPAAATSTSASASSVPPTNRPCRRVPVPGRVVPWTGQLGDVATEPAQQVLGRLREVGPAGPQQRGQHRRAQPLGVRRERGGDLVGRWLGDQQRELDGRGRRRAGRRAVRVASPPISADRSRPPTPYAAATPTPAWSSSASTCWAPVPDAATMPTGPGATTLANPVDAVVDGGRHRVDLENVVEKHRTERTRSGNRAQSGRRRGPSRRARAPRESTDDRGWRRRRCSPDAG